MDMSTYGAVRACLPEGRTLFYYERDRYAVFLPQHLLAAGWTARALKESRFGKLLTVPCVRDYLAAIGRLDIDPEWIALVPFHDPVAWRLTLSRWGNADSHAWNQTTCKGANLVLQLNLPEAHNRQYRQLVSPSGAQIFNYSGHPVSRNENTLAWARMDVDLNTGEALIEEIQSDWVRAAASALRNPRRYYDAGDGLSFPRFRTGLRRYCEEVLPRYGDGWQETMMAAVLNFIVSELGIRKIYFHEFDSGNALKRINARYSAPPRSIYTSLPRRFCYRLVEDEPRFIEQYRNRPKSKSARARFPGELKFWLLDLESPPDA